MKRKMHIKKRVSEILLGIFIITAINPIAILQANDDQIIYPLKQISKLECRFKDWSELSSSCKQSLPVLKTKDYEKYAKKNGGYNDFTRIYTVLWASSYKYGWDVGNGGHMGTDIATSKGTPVYSIANGKVLHAKYMGALGNSVSIEHFIKGKKIVSNYSHLSKINVSVGERVDMGEKIGEVGSTGNSTGNHLHFQIDLDTPLHPYYYNYNKCPYDYYKITEGGLCFDDLNNNTIDPLLFLETAGTVLDNIQVTKVSRSNFQENNDEVKQDSNLPIFYKTVYIGYPRSDVKEVQRLFKDMGIYNGKISGDYNDILETVIAYQLQTEVIGSRNENGAGWFGPKTRSQAREDYYSYLLGKTTSIENIKVKSKVKTQNISRKNLLTREEIEAREVEAFLKNYNVSLELRNVGGNIKLGDTSYLDLKITNKKGKPFRGTMPGGMTFIIDSSKVQVFPQKLYYFTDGERTIHLKGLLEGDTSLYIKIGNTTIKTIPIKVYKNASSIVPTSGVILGNKKMVMGESKTSIVLFKDDKGKKLINIGYGDNYQINTNNAVKVCLKSGELKDIKKIYNTKCKNEGYKDYVNFDYNSTVGGLVIFDYKSYGREAKIEIKNTTRNKVIQDRNIVVVNPKGLSSKYAYKQEILSLLSEGIADGINRGYFLEERNLNEYDALSWIRSSLIKMNENPEFFPKKQEIENNLRGVFTRREKASKYKSLSRSDFLSLAHDYLILDKSITNTEKNYRDLDEVGNEKASLVFGKETWKDKFGESYFRPKEKITRGEGVYLIAKAMEQNSQTFLVRK